MNSGRLSRIERDNSKEKRKRDIQNARKNKQKIHEFEAMNSMFFDNDDY
ncbi:MAG: hypothetical protein SOT71_04910 [Romboutsia timonensis]|nr:hypothetical protein [Romboutsia timonensis]MDY2881973.1 hypothetical protein [Romboutsia timonensis]